MDLPDCPPGAEGYHDSVIEVPKKPAIEETCTKAEQEFQEHLNSLKIKVENAQTRCMVERRGRDISGKWIYLCYPCAAMCSGESILQTHISGKKHKGKLAMRTVWPKTIFEQHPYILSEKGSSNKNSGATEEILQKMAEEVDLYNKDPSDLDLKYNKHRTVRCHIQDSIDAIKAPLIGVEYLVEHPPDQPHYEPSYICTLCTKQGHPRTIINHMTCFWHRYNYLVRHFPKACLALGPYRAQQKYREGVSLIMSRLAQRIDDTYGRMRPVNIEKEEYEKDKERIHQWIFKGCHFSENSGQTFEGVVDVDLITSLHKSSEETTIKLTRTKDPSPPVVAAPSKPHFNNFTRSSTRQERRADSNESLSDISDDLAPHSAQERESKPPYRARVEREPKPRFEPYPEKRPEQPFRPRQSPVEKSKPSEKPEKKAPNYAYKVKLAEEKRKAAEDSAKKTLAYHEKNPEKHPLYPEEWKKFWNRRYKEIQAEGKDPSKHDFKPEWILFWTARMKNLHDEELRVNVDEIYRKMCLPAPDLTQRPAEKKSPEPRRRSPEPRRRSPEPRRRSPEPRRRSPEPRRRSPEPRRRSPEPRRRSPEPRRRSPEVRRPEYRRPERRRSPESKHISPVPRRRTPDYRRERRSPEFRPALPRRRSVEKRQSPSRLLRTRSRSPAARSRSPARTHIQLQSVRRSRSPLSRRDEASRNRSPVHTQPQPPRPQPSLQTVMISDDELRPDDNLSPWNSDNDVESLGSLPDARSPVRERDRSHTSSLVSHASRRRDYAPRTELQDMGPPENVVATLRLLVALEDYLGSLGPKIVDLLTEALKMEKEKGNSSEELLVRESAVVLIETAKEKLKGAAQAGLVPHAAAAAVRTAVVRAASTLHEADTRSRRNKQVQATSKPPAPAPVPVAGVGDVDRAQIAQQMAEALIAQGKTDVSSEELAQLVDAVVGMAEAKKREAEVKKKVEARALVEKASRPVAFAPVKTSTASALQMLQSAYDENDKKVEKEDVPDAMDGLSDSDLETLLKNFNELSAEEQHSLIAYLKKLEAREPQRVERLRQYVSAAATTTARPEETPAVQPTADVKLVTIESDDDDYTVEEVLQSATQKVKEDQIRQEMEIVKKSLETKPAPPKPVKAESPKPAPVIDLSKNMSSATDLLALVQASIQSSSNTPMKSQTADVVTSNTQPRSFGDLPEAPVNVDPPPKALLQNPPMNIKPLINNPPQNNSFGNLNNHQPGGKMNRQSSNQMNYGGPNPSNFAASNPSHFVGSNTNNFVGSNQTNFGGNRNFQNSPNNQPLNTWEQRPMNNIPDNRQSILGAPPTRPHFDNFGQETYNQGPRGNFMNGRIQDNYDTRPVNMNQQQFGNYDPVDNMNQQQFGNYDQGNNNQQFGNNMNQQQPQFGNTNQANNFRGRGAGRGPRGGHNRGRGRGGYY